MGYDELQGYTNQTCSEDQGQNTFSVQYQFGDLKSNFEACANKCDDEKECEYFFFDDNHWCGGYSTCDFGRTADQHGDHYKKKSKVLMISKLLKYNETFATKNIRNEMS